MSLRALFNEPFGPYLDSFLLNETCKSTPTQVLTLRDLQLELNENPTGLTEIDTLHPTPLSHPVRFRGVLELSHLSWLTPAGLETLQNDVRQKDRVMSGRKSSALTLASIYGQSQGGGKGKRGMGGSTLKVLIQGEKNMPALYLMNETLAPDGLLLTTKDRNRKYKIHSLHIETYHLSSLHLSRYHTLHTLSLILSHHGQTTPLKDRTPEFFVSNYLKLYADSPPAARRRLIYDSDKDLEVINLDGDLANPRFVRTPHRNEITHLFARHAEWIVEEQKLRRRDRRIIDVEIWAGWVEKIKKKREEAKQRGVRWGVGEEEEEGEGEGEGNRGYYGSDADEDVGGREIVSVPRKRKAEEGVRSRPLPIRPIKRTSIPTSSTRASTPPNRFPSPLPLPLPSTSTSARPGPQAQPHAVYDSDFSVTSSSAYSSSSESIPHISQTDPALYAALPTWSPTSLSLPADLRWVCPSPDCPYSIDLLNLTEENLVGVPPHAQKFMKDKKWDAGTEKMWTILGGMVKTHWVGHLRKEGLRLVKGRKGFKVEWIPRE